MSNESKWRQVSGWDGVANPERLGAAKLGSIGVAVELLQDLGLLYIIGSKEDQAAIAKVLLFEFGLTLPMTPTAVTQGDLTIVWAGPFQWLAVSRQKNVVSQLTNSLKGYAAISDQSDGRIVIIIQGARVRDLLAKGCSVDLHPRSLSRDGTVLTTIGGIGAQLWQVQNSDAFYIVVARSMAGSFWSWLTHSGLEFGIDVRVSP